MRTKQTVRMMVVLFGLLLSRDASAFYNPQTGRWLSRDPIEEQGELNLYGFVESDPISEADLFGLSPFTPTSACKRTALRASLTIPGWMTPALSTISKIDRWDFKFHGDYTECAVCCNKGGFGKTATINAGLVLEMKFSGRKIPLGIATFEYGLFGRIGGSGGLYGGYSTCDKSAYGGGCFAVTGEVGLIASVDGGRLRGLEVGAGARGGFRFGYQMCMFCTADGCAVRHRVCGALRGRYWGYVKVGKRKWEIYQEYSMNSCTPWGYIAGGPQPGEPDVAPPIAIE